MTKSHVNSSFISCALHSSIVPFPVVLFTSILNNNFIILNLALSLLVPAYFYPSDNGSLYWDKLADAAMSVQVTAILNPNSGPGNAQDSSYAAKIDQVREIVCISKSRLEESVAWTKCLVKEVKIAKIVEIALSCHRNDDNHKMTKMLSNFLY